MINVIVELSKYVILTLMVIYTFHCFYLVKQQSEEERNESLRQQLMLIFFMDFTAFLVIYLKTGKFQVVLFYVEMMAFFAGIQILYRIFYKKASILLLNNMCMLLSVGFIMLCRLDVSTATRQLVIVAGVNVVALIVPVLIRKMKFLKDLTWVYAGIGIVLLAAVFVLAKTSYGAKLSLMGIQPSEAIKITFVFFMAALLRKGADFSKVVQATVVAGLHVGILVLSRDLGSAVIFFAAYLVMIYVASRNVGYLALGLAGGSAGAVVAYHLFGHVRQRVTAWKDPMAVYQNEGYQIVQSLFAIGTGGWFGMGLYQGMPDKIPLGSSDFVFASISEELGGAFAVCIVLVCFSCFLMFLNIAMQIRDQFYKLIALGLGCVYGVQVFLNVGGVIKFIPSTGLTLPLVSYGGSSILCTIIMFAIIQGLYIMRQDEEGESNEQKSRGRKQKRDYSKKKVNGVRSQQKPKIKSGQTGYRGHESGSGRPRGGASSRFDEDEIEEIW